MRVRMRANPEATGNAQNWSPIATGEVLVSFDDHKEEYIHTDDLEVWQNGKWIPFRDGVAPR